MRLAAVAVTGHFFFYFGALFGVAVEPFMHLYIQNQGDWKLRVGFLGKPTRNN